MYINMWRVDKSSRGARKQEKHAYVARRLSHLNPVAGFDALKLFVHLQTRPDRQHRCVRVGKVPVALLQKTSVRQRSRVKWVIGVKRHADRTDHNVLISLFQREKRRSVRRRERGLRIP